MGSRVVFPRNSPAKKSWETSEIPTKISTPLPTENNRGYLAEKKVGISLQSTESNSKTGKIPTIIPTKIPTEINRGKTLEKIVGKVEVSHEKKSWKNVRKSTSNRIQNWFAYDVEYRKLKSGYSVMIRTRLRWDSARYRRVLQTAQCPELTARMIAQLKVYKFMDASVDALRHGGIDDGTIRELQTRPGHGNGLRYNQLTDDEKILAARFSESYKSDTGRGYLPGSKHT